MKTIFVLAAMVSVTLARFCCDNCDNNSERKGRTGCRFFCYFDQDNSGTINREEINGRFEQDKDTDAGMTRPRFVELMRDNVQLCEDESNTAFYSITFLGGSDPTLIEEVDIDAMVDIFEGLTGQTTLDKETFLEIYKLIYMYIGNENCEIGN